LIIRKPDYNNKLIAYSFYYDSVERMLEHLALSGNKTLDPMQITKTKGKRCQITLKKNYKEDPKLLFALFYVHGCVFYWFSML